MPTNQTKNAFYTNPPIAAAVAGGALVVLLAVWVLFTIGGDQVTGWASDWIQLVTMMMACGTAAWAAKAARTCRVGWALIAAAVGCWITAQLIWISVNNGTGQNPTAENAIGVFFLCSTPLLALGALYLFTPGLTPQSAYRRLVDAFLAVGALVIILWFVFLRDAVAGLGGADPVSIGFTIIYPIGDAIILGLVAALFPRMDSMVRRRLLPVAGSLVLIAAADVAFAYVNAQGDYSSGNYFDVLWAAAEVIIAATAIAWARNPPAAPTRHQGTSYNLYPLVPAFAGMVVLVAAFAATGRLDASPFYMAAAMFAALILRQILHVGEMRQGARHVQQALTREQAAREATTKSEARLLVAQKIAAVGFWESDAKGKTITLSPEMIDLIGGQPGVLAGAPTPTALLTQVLPEADRDAFGRAWTDARTTGRTTEVEHRILAASGTMRWVRTRFQPAHDNMEGMFGVTHDITNIKQAETARRDSELARAEVQRLAEVNEFRTQLLNLASHELNTPIGAVKLQLHILKLRLGKNPSGETTNALAILDRNVERLANLVADTLDVARIQNGKLPVNLKPTAVETLVKDALETFLPVAKRQGVSLNTDIERDLVAILDQKRMTQVLFNLVSNALKFTPKGGTVTIAAAKLNGHARITVTDTGAGLSPDQISRLFKPFAQVHAGEVVNRGTGLGLFISRGIAEQHGGAIWCESPGLDRGAQFIVEIPAEAPHVQASHLMAEAA